jgi:hypothetical protein
MTFPFDFARMMFWAVTENTPELANASRMPPKTTAKPSKTRRLKKADREADFFFME